MQTRSPEASIGLSTLAWEDFTPLTDTLAAYLPRTIFDEPLIGPSGERVPFEARVREGVEINISGEYAYPLGYVRIGDIVFLDHRFQTVLSPEVKEQFADNIIWLWKFVSAIGEGNYTHLNYAALPIHALATLDLGGKHVLDLGAGDGVMGLVAYKMGAKVSSVELDGQYEWVYNGHLTVNGLPESDFDFIVEDLTNPGSIVDRLQEPQVDVVVANIGPTQGDAHLEAISLLDRLPSVQTFIGGSYVREHPEMGSEEAIRLLADRGYSTNFRELSFRRFIQAFIVDKDK